MVNKLTINRYTDENALSIHQSTPLYHNIIELFTTQPELLGAPPVLTRVNTLHTLTRASVAKEINPYIVYGTVEYTENGLDQSLSYWKDVFETTQQKEEGTLSYSLCRDVEDPKILRTVEVYTSEEYLWDVHAKSDALAENVKNTKHLRTGLKHVFLRIVGGYFYK